MSQHPEQNPTPEPDRLGPRPLRRPSVDPAQAAVFGRPPGVDSAFANRNGSHPDPALRAAPPPAAALTEAFSRPPENPDVVLQRPPVDQNGDAPVDAPLWSTKEADPWRDPGAGAMIGPPALDKPEPETKAKAAKDTGQLLSVPELLFGRRVKTSALIILAVVVLVIGGAGGVVGWVIARAGDSLTSDVTLAEVQPGVERPPGSIADIAKRVAPAVVTIEVIGANSGETGSGAVIDGQGYIVTNNHVIQTAAREASAKMTAVFPDGSRVDAKLVGRDPKTDLAVIKVQVNNPTVLQFANSDAVAVGDTVIAVGSPLGLSHTFTEGIVSAVHRPRLLPGDGGDPPVAYDAIQTDASINPGNSGGPLVDATGAVVGINSSILATEDKGSIGLGFAIPANDARKIVQALIRDGQVKHAEIGINAVTDVSAGSSQGARAANVAENSAAQKAGIREGDIITKVGDRIVRNSAELTVAVRAHEIGAKVPVVLVRDGRELTIDVVLQSD
ncbi:S1C family serine protease [Kibdelosporangium aridum]|uniref:Serine protease, S1-C subfamily, contains C-terminal PDZ domain n=1 Tax=Kibdelosporangium aridum TaxID=2030 RepID=A0A1W2F278_KIBAR|nr:trypsin-like peptidase domain-containing protein [Kibdelosporangium aridum]SMD16059.1 serine protease, S1-C subfamily, contains C-terminal PDZ domain [Kibdelosporangium aridum]